LPLCAHGRWRRRSAWQTNDDALVNPHLAKFGMQPDEGRERIVRHVDIKIGQSLLRHGRQTCRKQDYGKNYAQETFRYEVEVLPTLPDRVERIMN
jgi:hypothetical protein